MIDPLLETMGLRGGACFMDSGEAIELGRDCTGRVDLFVFLGGKASCLLDVFKKGNEFVFKVGGGVLREYVVGVGVL